MEDTYKFIQFLFPEHREFVSPVCKNILTILDQNLYKYTNNLETLKLKKDILLQFDQTLGCSYIVQNSNICYETVRSARNNKRKLVGTNIDETKPPKKKSRKSLVTETDRYEDFVEHLKAMSEPADSSEPDGIRHFFLPIDVVVVSYPKLGKFAGSSLSSLKLFIDKSAVFYPMKKFTGRCPYCKTHAILATRLNVLSRNFYDFPLHHAYHGDFPQKSDFRKHVSKKKP